LSKGVPYEKRTEGERFMPVPKNAPIEALIKEELKEALSAN